MDAELRRVIREGVKTLLGIIVLAGILVAFPSYVFLKSGEMTSPRDAIELQARHPSLLFAPAYSNPASVYKLAGTDYFDPEILLIGTSRAMEFRASFFNKSFYNAAGATNRVNQDLFFLRNLSVKPSFYILILDQNLFNEHWVEADPYESVFLRSPLPPPVTLRNNLAKIYLDFLAGKFSLHDLEAPGIGLRAKVVKSGFRSDGSNDPHMGYAFFNETQQDYQFRYTLQTIENGASIFRYGSEVSQRALRSLEELLTYAEEENITVIGISPPYPPSIWNLIRGDSRFSYLKGLNETVNEIFRRHHLFFFDFSNASHFNVTDAEMQDGLHASELANARALLSVANQKPWSEILNKSGLEAASRPSEKVSVHEG